jgi:protein-disulfide isomerase
VDPADSHVPTDDQVPPSPLSSTEVETLEGPVATALAPVPPPTSAESRSDARPGPGYGWAPAIALFAGGFLTCLGIVLAVLALNGTIRPAATAGTGAGDPTSTATSGTAAGPGTADTPSPGPTTAAAQSPDSAGSPPGSAAPSASAAASPSADPLVTPQPIVQPSALTPAELADGHALGKPTALVTVEIWEDFQCPFCLRFTRQVEPRLVATFVETGKVRLVFRDLPFLGEESAWAAVAARLAEQQGKFWPYHDYLFANQLGENVGSYAAERLKLIATAVGLERSAFDAGLTVAAARTLYGQIKAESDADAARLGIRSTPTIVVDGKPLGGYDWATVEAAITAALASK